MEGSTCRFNPFTTFQTTSIVARCSTRHTVERQEAAQRVEGIRIVNLDEHLRIVRVRRQVVVHDAKKTGAVGGTVGDASSLDKILVSRRKDLGCRTSNRIGSEAGETSAPGFSTKNRADIASR